MKLFISYRRGDTLARSQTGRLKKSLEKDYRCKKVFVDQQDLGATKDFPKSLAGEVAKSDFLLLLIGPNWEDIFHRKGKESAPDFVLHEIKAALEKDVTIVPILLDDTSVPDWDALPPPLGALGRASALPLGTALNHEADLERIVRQLQDNLKEQRRIKTWWDWLLKKNPSAPPAIIAAPPVDLKPLKILVVMGTNVPYEEALVEAMRKRLEAELPSCGRRLVMHPLKTKFDKNHASPSDPLARESWNRLIARGKQVFFNEPVDYVVSAATFASQATRDGELAAALGARGQIYMGVTSPQAAGLVNQSRIAGVQYGTGGRDYALMFHKLFPTDQRLVFIYNDVDGYVQDRAFAAEIAVLNNELAPSLGGRKRFELRPLGRVMTASDLEPADPASPAASPVYMAWYDLDELISRLTIEGDPILSNPNLWVIPSTYTKENIIQFGVIVGVNDEAGGEEAANIVLHHIMMPTKDLQSFPMRTHGYRATIWEKMQIRKGIRINPDIRKLSHKDPAFKFERHE